MCLYPRLIANPKYKETKKNKGIIPPINDKRAMLVPIGCGKCMECRKKKTNEWKIRLIEEAKENVNGKFVTLTFSNESYNDLRGQLILETSKYCERITNKTKIKYEKAGEKYKLEGYDLDNAIATLAVRQFLNRWKKLEKKIPKYWLVTELGHEGCECLHMHGIIWEGNEANVKETGEKIEKIWKYGWVWKYKIYNGKYINYVNERTINYMSKYMLKLDEKHKEYQQIILCSNGIGSNYTKSNYKRNNKFRGKETMDSYIKDDGRKSGLPIYYKNKIYSEEEREKLWMYKLDKEERWVNGQKLKFKTEEEINNYLSILKRNQKLNERMGFGNYKKDWERVAYEKKIRIMKQMQRKS